MAWTLPTNRININSKISFGAAWNEIDITGLVPAGTRMIILHVRNTNGTTNYACNARPDGSLENRIPNIYMNSHRQLLVVIEGNLIFEGYFENSALDVAIVAYTDDTSYYSTSIDISTSTIGSYADTDVSANVPAGMKSVWLELYEPDTYIYSGALRKNGISHDIYERVTHNSGGSVLGYSGIDANRIFEQKIENGLIDCYLWGFSGDNVISLDSPIIKTSVSNGSWNDIDLSGEPSIPNTAIGVIVQILVDFGYIRNINLRKKGSIDNITTNLLTINNSWNVVGIDVNRCFQVYTDFYQHVTLYIVGYIDIGDTDITNVYTYPVTDIKSTSAIGNGTIIDNSGTISERGFCWSPSINPTISDDKIIISGTTGNYSGNITGLSPITIYYVRAYVITGMGIFYGNEVYFQSTFPEEDEIYSEPIPGIIMGEYIVPDDDIIEIGEIRIIRSQDLSITSSGVTIILDNNTGKYSPGKDNFIWYGSTWYLKEVEMNLTYQDAGDYYVIFKGVITNWKVNEKKDAAYDAQPEPSSVEITVDDHCSLLENRMIGKPDDDGSPNPFVHGNVFRQAEALNDLTFWDANDTIDYETGDLTQIDATVIDGSGAMAASIIDPYEGDYCAYHSVAGAGNAYGKQDVLGASGSTDIMITAMIKFTSIPADPVLNNLHIFEIQDTTGATKMSVCSTWSGDDRDLFALDIPLVGTYASNVHITDYQDRWFRLTLMAVNDNSDRMKCLIRVFLDGEDIITKSIGSLIPDFRYVTWGIKQGGTETWALSTDNIECFNVAYPNGYYLAGGDYMEINAVYVDGGFWPRRNIKRWRAYPIETGWVWWLGYVGRTSLPENYRVDLNYCLIDFMDLENPISGSVLIDAVKDYTTHPVDIIEDILSQVELDSWVDTASFASAIGAMPDDIIGVYIDDQSASDVITDICQKMLLSFYEFEGKMKIIPYLGTPLITSVLSLNQDNCHSTEQNIDMMNLRNEIQVKWGWFDRNRRLFYRTKNDGFIALVGTQTYDFDMSFGQDISTNDQTMAQSKADLLLKRLGGPLDEYILAGNLTLGRLSLGDGVLVQSSFNDIDQIYEVMEKTINLMEKTVEIIVCRYMGES